MTRDARAAALAAHRFGLGPRADTIGAIASDPRGALLAELDRPTAGLVADAGLRRFSGARRAAGKGDFFHGTTPIRSRTY